VAVEKLEIHKRARFWGMVNGQLLPTNRLLGILARHKFGYLSVDESFNSHTCYRELRSELAENVILRSGSFAG
jgi:hypothetical protein